MQEIDLPPITPVYRERRFYKKVCACGCCNRDYAPRKRGGNAITFGRNIRAVATYLSVVQFMPYERLQSLFEAVFNVRISQGTLANIVREMLDKSKPAIELIERLIKESAIVGFSTSLRIRQYPRTTTAPSGEYENSRSNRKYPDASAPTLAPMPFTRLIQSQTLPGKTDNHLSMLSWLSSNQTRRLFMALAE